jgi:hypothetical protein
MKWAAVSLIALLLVLAGSAAANEALSVCYNYGCLSEDEVLYSDAQLLHLQELLADAHGAVHERALIGVAIGWMLGWAGQQTPISADRGGNFADDGVYGRMDCIDHSTTTTRLLRLMERRGWLRFHRVLEPALRKHFLLFDHFSAQIEEIEKVAPDGDEVARYVVDSWFFDNGLPAVVIPLENWLAGEGPDVEHEREQR